MAKVSLRSISGAHVELVVQSLEASLQEKMQVICSSFNKPYPQTWAVLTSKKVSFEQPDSQPFLSAQDGDIYMVVFQKNNVLELQFMSKEHKKILMVKQNMSLRGVQHLLCRAFQQRFPMMCATLNIGGTTYDNFADMPFLQLRDNEKEVHVEFERTPDMNFFDKCDRLPQYFPDPFDDVPELHLDS